MFKTVLARSLASLHAGFERFYKKYYLDYRPASNHALHPRRLRGMSLMHAVDHEIAIQLTKAHRATFMSFVMQEILEANGVEKYGNYPYPSTITVDTEDNMLSIHWEDMTEGCYSKLSAALRTDGGCHENTVLQFSIQYVDAAHKVAWSSDQMKYGDHLEIDLSEFLKVFQQMKPLNVQTMQRDGWWVTEHEGKPVLVDYDPPEDEYEKHGT